MKKKVKDNGNIVKKKKVNTVIVVYEWLRFYSLICYSEQTTKFIRIQMFVMLKTGSLTKLYPILQPSVWKCHWKLLLFLLVTFLSQQTYIKCLVLYIVVNSYFIRTWLFISFLFTVFTITVLQPVNYLEFGHG